MADNTLRGLIDPINPPETLPKAPDFIWEKETELPKAPDFIWNKGATGGLAPEQKTSQDVSTAEKTWNTAEAIGHGLFEGIQQIPHHLKEVEAGGQPYGPKAEDLEKEKQATEAREKSYSESEEGQKPGLFGASKAEYSRDVAQQVPQTIEQISGGLAGAKLGGAAGGVPGAVIGGVAGALASSLFPAYRQTKTQFVRQAVEAEDKRRQDAGQSAMNTDEKRAYAEKMEPDAIKYGLYEVGTEIPGTALETAAMLNPAVRAAEAIAKPVAKGAWAAFKAAALGAAKPIAAAVISEPIEETVSQQLEQPLESQYGITQEAPRKLTSFDDWAKSYQEVIGPTLRGLAPLILSGGAIGGHGAVVGGRATQRVLDEFDNIVQPPEARPNEPVAQRTGILPMPALEQNLQMAYTMSKTDWGKTHQGVQDALNAFEAEAGRRTKMADDLRAYDPATDITPDDTFVAFHAMSMLRRGDQHDAWMANKVAGATQNALDIIRNAKDDPLGWYQTIGLGMEVLRHGAAGNQADWLHQKINEALPKFTAFDQQNEQIAAGNPKLKKNLVRVATQYGVALDPADTNQSIAVKIRQAQKSQVQPIATVVPPTATTTQPTATVVPPTATAAEDPELAALKTAKENLDQTGQSSVLTTAGIQSKEAGATVTPTTEQQETPPTPTQEVPPTPTPTVEQPSETAPTSTPTPTVETVPTTPAHAPETGWKQTGEGAQIKRSGNRSAIVRVDQDGKWHATGIVTDEAGGMVGQLKHGVYPDEESARGAADRFLGTEAVTPAAKVEEPAPTLTTEEVAPHGESTHPTEETIPKVEEESEETKMMRHLDALHELRRQVEDCMRRHGYAA